jgi:hypothetical protein
VNRGLPSSGCFNENLSRMTPSLLEYSCTPLKVGDTHSHRSCLCSSVPPSLCQLCPLPSQELCTELEGKRELDLNPWQSREVVGKCAGHRQEGLNPVPTTHGLCDFGKSLSFFFVFVVLRMEHTVSCEPAPAQASGFVSSPHFHHL